MVPDRATRQLLLPYYAKIHQQGIRDLYIRRYTESISSISYRFMPRLDYFLALFWCAPISIDDFD